MLMKPCWVWTPLPKNLPSRAELSSALSRPDEGDHKQNTYSNRRILMFLIKDIILNQGKRPRARFRVLSTPPLSILTSPQVDAALGGEQGADGLRSEGDGARRHRRRARWLSAEALPLGNASLVAPFGSGRERIPRHY